MQFHEKLASDPPAWPLNRNRGASLRKRKERYHNAQKPSQTIRQSRRPIFARSRRVDGAEVPCKRASTRHKNSRSAASKIYANELDVARKKKKKKDTRFVFVRQRKQEENDRAKRYRLDRWINDLTLKIKSEDRGIAAGSRNSENARERY